MSFSPVSPVTTAPASAQHDAVRELGRFRGARAHCRLEATTGVLTARKVTEQIASELHSNGMVVRSHAGTWHELDVHDAAGREHKFVVRNFDLAATVGQQITVVDAIVLTGAGGFGALFFGL